MDFLFSGNEKIARFCWVGFVFLGAVPAFFGIALATSVILLAFGPSESLTDTIQYITGIAVFLAFSVSWFGGVLYGYYCNEWRKRWLPFVIELFPTATLFLWVFTIAKNEFHQPIVLSGILYLATLIAHLVIGAAFAREPKSNN